MSFSFGKTIASVLILGTAALASMPASAAPAKSNGSGLLVPIASGGWASRAQGHRSTYGSPYAVDVYGYGYGNEPDEGGYVGQPYNAPIYGGADGYGYGFDDGGY